MKYLRQALAATTQQGDRALGGPDRPRQLRGWKTVREIAEDLKFTVTAPTDPHAAVREWLRRHKVPTIHRGRTILVDQFDIDRVLSTSGKRSA